MRKKDIEPAWFHEVCRARHHCPVKHCLNYWSIEPFNGIGEGMEVGENERVPRKLLTKDMCESKRLGWNEFFLREVVGKGEEHPHFPFPFLEFESRWEPNFFSGFQEILDERV